MVKAETLEDIKGFIDGGIEEGLTLEYKRELGHNREIAKSICAFANTEGGIIIYGVNSKDRIPTSLNWIEEENIEEKIQNIAATSIQPKLEFVRVLRCPNPSNEKQAVFIAEVQKGLNAPHMFDNRYYKRRGSVALPMDNDEVRHAMLGIGRNAALKYEIAANLDLVDKTNSLMNRLFGISPERRHSVALIPFHTDAWNAVIASGLLFAFSSETSEHLVEAYRTIHEVNSMIDWLRAGRETIVHTTADENSFQEHGTYVPSIIQDKLGQLRNLLQHLDELLRGR